MDRIRIEGIELHGFHGVPAAEREVGHRYRIDAVLELDLRAAARADDVAETVDYGEVARVIIGVGTGPSVQLVETLAERMAEQVLARFPRVQAIELEVAKIHPPVALQFHAAVIQIRRSRATGA
ncbi:MAG: dihydroneopterin aldolase [Armatimonadetes bacterium]|jgi:dihydroneopterin aldolase|nr:dihydroneopterin aldolase [Armatimonadota bacterium]